MKRFNKIVATILVFTFSFSNISFAVEQNFFKLAPPSKFSGLEGPEFREAAQIRLGVMGALKGVDNINADSLRALGHVTFGEKSVFTATRVTGTILFYNLWESGFNFEGINIDKGSYLVKALIRDSAYYCLISGNGLGRECDVSIVPERAIKEALKNGAIRFTHESPDAGDAAAINRYTEHEVSDEGDAAIDEWIRARMEKGAYAFHNVDPKRGVLYRNAQKVFKAGEGFSDIVRRISSYLIDVGVKSDNVALITRELSLKSLVLIPYSDKKDLPVITVGGQKIRVTAHTSQFAIYIFLPGPLYRNVIDTHEGGRWNDEVSAYIEKWLVHEIGAMCGLDVMVLDGEARNILDSIIDSRKAWDGPGKYSPASELKDLKPINILDLGLRHDYAAGSVDEKRQGIFNRAMSVLLALIMPLVPGCGKPTDKYIERGNLFFNAKYYDEAIADFTKAIELNPEYDFAYNNRGLTYTKLNQYDRAIVDLTKAIELNPKNAFAYRNRSSAYLGLNQYDRAITDCTKAIELEPEFTVAYNDRGYAYTKLNQYDRALSDLTKAIELNPKYAPAYYNRGLAHYLSNQHDKGSADFDKALALDPNLKGNIDALKKEIAQRKASPVGPSSSLMPSGTPSTMAAFMAMQAAMGATEISSVSAEADSNVAVKNPADKQHINKLIENFLSINGYIRDKYSDDLARIGGAAFDQIVEMLKGEDKEVRIDTLILLRKIKDDRVMPHIIKAMGDPDKECADFAARMLEEFWPKSKVAIPALLEALRNGNAGASWIVFKGDEEVAIQALDNIAKALREDPSTGGRYGFKRDLFCRLDLFDRKETPKILPYYIDKLEPQTRDFMTVLLLTNQTLSEKLTDLGLESRIAEYAQERETEQLLAHPEVFKLLSSFSHLDRKTVKSYVENIVTIGFEHEERPLYRYRNNSFYAADTILEITESIRTVELARRSPVVKILIQEGLIPLGGSMGHKAVAAWNIGDIPLLEKLLQEDAHGYYKETVIKALSLLRKEIQAKDDSAKLLNTLKSNDLKDQYSALMLIDTMEHVPDSYIPHLVSILGNNNWWHNEAAKSILIRIGANTVQPLIHSMQNDNLVLRRYAAAILGDMHDLRAGPALLSALSDSDILVRANAAKSLGDLQYREAIPQLRQIIERHEYFPDGEAASMAIEKMGASNVGPSSSAAPMVKELEDARAKAASVTAEANKVLWLAGNQLITREAARKELANIMPMPGVSERDRSGIFDALITSAMAAAFFGPGGPTGTNYPEPSADDIRALAAKMKETNIEVYMPASHLINNETGEFRRTLEKIFGDRLKKYQNAADLPGLVKNPARAIVMTVDLKDGDAAILSGMKGARFMNFAGRDDLDNMTGDQYHNYIAEVLSILLSARVITSEEAKNRTGLSYGMLAHLLEDYLPDGVEAHTYINKVVDDKDDLMARLGYIARTVLRALPIDIYNKMKAAVEVLWSA